MHYLALLKEKINLLLKDMLCAHSIMLSYEGIPAIYLLSLLGTKNDNQLYKKTKIKRSINRHIYNYEYLDCQLNKDNSNN